MSVPLTIPVSMPHHYSNRFFGGNGSPSGGQPPGAPPQPSTLALPTAATVSSVLMAPPPSLAVASVSGMQPAVHGEHRTMPVRKQSVFEAPTGLSALRRTSSRSSSSSLNYVLTPPSPPPPSESTAASPHLFSSSGRYLSSASPPDSWSSSSGSSHPLDLSGETSSSVIHNTSSASTVASRLVAPSKEELSQHISRIIHENNAVVGSFEGPFLGRNHSSGGFYYSRRSMSTTVQPSPSLVQSVITSSGARASLGQQYQFAAYQPQQQQQSSPLDSIRRFSSDVAGSQSSYSRLQSALEGKATEVVPPPPPPAPASTKVHPGRKYSEIPYRQQAPHPESFKYPLNQASYLHQHPKSALKHKHSMILGGHEHLLDVLPALNESSRSNSEPSLVRNLLTSKTSPFAHLVGSDLAASTTSAASTSASSQQSDSSIIKDLLLKSRATSQVEAPAASLFSRSTPSPNKRTRTESASYDPTVTPQLGSSSMFTCKLCRIPFRNRQNLEVHQKIYCRGSEAARTSGTDSLPERLGAKRSHQEMGYAAPIPERKVSVLERPSIITYSSDSPLSSLSTMSLNSASSEQQQQQQSAQQPDDASFGNILKSKLLAQESDSYMTAPLKKRKISEPAFRYHDSKHRDSFIKPHRLSIMQPPVFHRHDRSSEHQLEILPAYMPYLQSRSVKITVKSPVLFPVLQDLLDTGTNHEFIVDDSPTVSSTFVPVIDLEDELPSSSEAKSPETQENPLVRSSLAAEDAESKDLKEVVSQLLEEVCAKVAASQSAEGEGESGDHSTAVTECLSDLVDSVTTEMTVPAEASPALSVASLAPSLPPQKKTSPARPTTLDLGRSYDQSARNQREVGTTVEHIRKISRLSIFVNRCSHQDEDGANKNQLVASTLISPDTPRAKRKYQQLYINGNAYTNLGLKVNPRPTYCCIYRLQPMFVTQDANPQLSMYSQWKVMPVPAGDILEQVGSPHELLSAYNSSEAVFAVSRSRLSLMEVATAATMGGIEVDPEETDAESAPPALPEIVKPTGTVTRDFLDKVSARLTNYMSSNLPVRPDPEADQFASPFPSRRYERTLQAALVSLGDGFSSRLSDTCSRSQYILTHSSYHRLSTQARTQQQRIRKRSRTHNVDFYKAPVPGKSTDMVVATSAISSASSSSNSTYLSQSEQASRLPLTPESSSIKLPEMSIAKPRKRSSTTSVMSATSLSSSTFSPFLTMHPMLGHLPAKSKQTVMYIMMMGQAPMSMSVPTVSSLATSKNMASRKFSECIGMKPNAIEENWAARIAADGSTEMVPKRIKIFEGGFKSNEDYTYVRGRGRGKYVCEECGIRCKKPSMLKKHIRTHTDLRPYSCRHCAFAFKTKGNLTKHMKSKAHHKKCVELGIIPVPTSIDDSQIDNDALAKQEQYELTCGSTGGLNQFADEDDDGDDDYDEEEYDDEDEEDDEGVPIPLIEQQRLTYIVPGQFDDADGPPEDSSAEASTPKAPPSHKSSDGSSTLSAAAFSPRPKLSLCSLSGVTASIVSCASTVTSTVSTLSPASSTLPLSITDIRPAVLLGEENDKYSGSLLSHHRKISSSSSRSSSSTGLPPSGPYLATSNITAGSKMIVSGSSSNLPAPRADRLATPPSQQQPLRQAATCALQSYHFGQAAASASAISAPSSSSGEPNKDRHLPGNQHSRSSTTSLSPPASITKEHEAEAARSLLILSGVSAPNSDNSSSLGGANSSGIFSIAKSPSNVAAALSTTGDSSENVHHRSPLAKKKHSSALLEYQQQHSNERGLAERVADNSEVLLLKAAERRISYEVASDHVLLASQQSQQQQQLHQQQQMAAESRQSPIEMMRRISANSQKVPDRRTSQPTSVIISRASPTESLEAYEYRRKRSRHERSISESATSSAHAQQQHLHLAEQFAAGHPGRPLSPKSQYLLSISSLITSSPTAAQFVSTTNSTMPPAGQFVSPNSAAAAAAAAQQLLHQQYANLGIRNPRAALIAEEIKRAANIANSNETAIQQQQMNALLLQQQHHQRMPTGVINAHSPPGALTRDSALQGANDAASNTETNSVFAQQQKLMAKFYETFKQQQQQPPAVQQAAPKHFPAANTLPYPGAFVLSSAELAAAKAQLGITTNGHSQLKVPTIQQPPSISPNLSYLVPSTASTEMAKKAFEKEPKRKSPLSFQERDMSPPQQQLPSAASRHFGNATANVPLPPPPASPLPAPVTFEPAKSTASAASDESDQPMDLSKTSALTVPEVAIHPPARDPSPHESLYSPLKAASVSSLSPPNVTLTPEQQQRQRQPSPVSPSQQLANVLAAAQQQNSPGRQRFRPMQEDKHLTEQLVRAFSPLNPDVNPMSFARSPTTNGRELYKNLRSEEFAHLSPGVHTPNRLPQNMMLLGSRNSAGPSASATSPSSTAGPSGSQGPIARTPNSIPNGYTTAEGKSVCTICMKQFSKPSQLRLHINIHFFERPFRCDSCAVSFRTKGHLQKHSRSVSHLNKLNMNITFGRPSTDNPRPFKCSDCKIAFRIHGHLAKHLRSKMHIMKLECLGKLPFGMFAEMERSNINLTPIDTTDCEKALESLRSLAQKLYDPRQMTWQVTESLNMDDVIEEDIDDELDEEGYPDEDMDMGESIGGSVAHLMTAESPEQDSNEDSTSGPLLTREPVASAVPLEVISTEQSNSSHSTASPPPASTQGASSSGIASTRSNTCHLCGRTFKAAKFLQVHLYTDHCDDAESATSDPAVSSV